MAPTQVSQLDQIARRWTDVLWIASRRLHKVDAHRVKIVYYLCWPCIVCGDLLPFACPESARARHRNGSDVELRFRVHIPASPLGDAEADAEAAATRVAAMRWLGRRSGLYAGISGVALAQQWPAIIAWLGSVGIGKRLPRPRSHCGSKRRFTAIMASI